jgi:hypothetical protein
MHRRFLLVLLGVVLTISLAPKPLAWAAFPVAAPGAFPIALVSNVYAEFLPTVAADARSNYVVAWVRFVFAEKRYEVVARRFSPDGQPAGSILPVTGASNSIFALAVNSRGDFVVVWQSLDQLGTIRGYPLRARLFTSGTVSPEIELSGRGAGGLLVAGLDRGDNFAVAWVRPSGDFLVRRFNSQGMPLGRELSPTDLGDPTASSPSLTMQDDGSFTMVWHSDSSGSYGTLVGRRFGPTGRPAGDELQINQDPLRDTRTVVAAMMMDGGLMVAWDRCDYSNLTIPCEVRARRFGADLLPVAGELTVSPADGRSHFEPAIAAGGADGYSAVAWESCSSFAVDCKISVQLYDPAGSPAPDMERLELDDNLGDAAVAGGAGGFMVVFTAFACDNTSPDCHGTAPEGAYGWRFLFPRQGRS